MLKDIGFLINRNNLFLLDKILKSNNKKLWVEIGSGNGEYIVALAKENRKDFFIAVEIKLKRILKTLKKIKREKLENVLVIHGSGEIFVEFFLNNKSVANFILNFPDPWFKKRHKKRRLINKKFYKILYDKLVDNGSIFIATDYSEYAKIILDEANQLGIFKKAKFTNKWLLKDIFTKYEKNFISNGKKIYYLTLNKKSG